MQSNGVIFENGSSPVANGDLLLSNGCEEEESGRVSSALAVRKRKQRKLTGMDADIIRLIGQHLREMGFHDTLENLMEESGCALEHPKAAKFRCHVISGEWEQANKALDGLVTLLEDPNNVEKMRLLLLKEKYLELLEGGSEMEALHCLRHELAPLPLHHSDKHIQVLTSYMMYPDKEELRKAASWPGVKGGARERLMDKLQVFLPASVMLPPKRLHKLLMQALQQQVDRCPFHYVEQSITQLSLLTDHICSRSHFPSETVHILSDHSDEVWYLKFSHNGSRLASGSRNGDIIIWNISTDHLKKEHVLKGQNDGIAFLAWSPNDTLLLSCGREDSPEALVFSTESGEVKCRVQNSAEDSLTCCAWNNDGQRFYVGGTRGQFLECNIDGTVTGSWEGIRVNAIATHPDSDLVYAADTHSRIRQYSFRDKSSSTLVQENHPIISFTLSRNGRNALLNVATQGVHVWDLHDRCLVRRYQGVTQGHYTIHSSYGGTNDSFIVSGSEDHHVYVWHHTRENPVIVLKGHSRAVNSVSWNPVCHNMLASASDDGIVRVWGTEEQMKARLEMEREREKVSETKGARAEMERAQEDGGVVGEADAAEGVERRGNQPPFEEEGEEEEEEEEEEGEGMMEVLQSEETSQSSETEPEPRSLELERAEGSSSSLSLSSERLEEGVNVAVAIMSSIPSAERRELSVIASLGRVERQTLGQPSHLQQETFSSSGAHEQLQATAGERMELLLTPIPPQESSVDPDDSQQSLDSSNGSQADVSQSEDFDDSLHQSESSRTSSSLPPATSMDASSVEGQSTASAATPGEEGGGTETRQQQSQPQQGGDGRSQRYGQTTGASISTVV